MKWDPQIHRQRACWVSHPVPSHTGPHRLFPSFAFLFSPSQSQCVEYWWGALVLSFFYHFFLGWRSPEVTSPSWQSVPISTMRLLTLAMYRWVLKITEATSKPESYDVYNCVFGTSSGAIVFNCSRKAPFLKCDVGVESISLIFSFLDNLYCIVLLFLKCHITVTFIRSALE